MTSDTLAEAEAEIYRYLSWYPFYLRSPLSTEIQDLLLAMTLLRYRLDVPSQDDCPWWDQLFALARADVEARIAKARVAGQARPSKDVVNLAMRVKARLVARLKF